MNVSIGEKKAFGGAVPRYKRLEEHRRCRGMTPYIGETCRCINETISEHVADLKHRRAKSSALAQHAEKTNHHVCIEEASVIARVSHFHHLKFREALEIEKRPCNHKDDG